MNTAYHYNANNAGVYARVVKGGRVGCGDRIVLV